MRLRTPSWCGTMAIRCTSSRRAVITAAGDLWNREFGTVLYLDLSCVDLAGLVRQVGTQGVWQARRDARAVLATRRREVLRLADRLATAGTMTFGAAR
jgi:hypothetical protein